MQRRLEITIHKVYSRVREHATARQARKSVGKQKGQWQSSLIDWPTFVFLLHRAISSSWQKDDDSQLRLRNPGLGQRTVSTLALPSSEPPRFYPCCFSAFMQVRLWWFFRLRETQSLTGLGVLRSKRTHYCQLSMPMRDGDCNVGIHKIRGYRGPPSCSPVQRTNSLSRI